MKLTKDYLKKIIKEAVEYEMGMDDMGDLASRHRSMGRSMDDLEMEMGDEDELSVDTPEDTDSEIMSRLDDIEGRLEDLESKVHGSRSKAKKEKDIEDEDLEDEKETEEESKSMKESRRRNRRR